MTPVGCCTTVAHDIYYDNVSGSQMQVVSDALDVDEWAFESIFSQGNDKRL